MRRAFYGVPSKSAPQRKTPCAEPPKSGERWGFPQNHEIFFYQLKRKFVNHFARSARSIFSLEKAKITLFAFSPYAKAQAGKVKPRHFDNGVPLKMPRRGKPLAQSRQQAANAGVVLKITENRRRQLAEIFVNFFSKKSKSHF